MCVYGQSLHAFFTYLSGSGIVPLVFIATPGSGGIAGRLLRNLWKLKSLGPGTEEFIKI